jgi:hypothetical protein
VQVVQRWILARLRNRRFFSLGDLNRAIRELVDNLNDRPMRQPHNPSHASTSGQTRDAKIPLRPSTPQACGGSGEGRNPFDR